MTDWRAAWEASQVKTGRRALELVRGGASWREAAAELGQDVDTLRRGAALAMAADHTGRTAEAATP